MNQRRKKRGFLMNRKKKPQKPSNYLRKQHNSWFSMHSHPFIFSMMCKCSYTVKKEHPNKPIEPPIHPLQQQQQQQQQRSNVTPLTTPKGSMIKRGKFKRRVTIESNHTSYVIDDAESPPLADEEDYIVFCFEEDGEFHVENSRSQDCSDHGSPRPHNLKVEEERFYFSPRLQSDGITSSTRFKQEGVSEARGRVEEDTECKDMDGIKSRGLDDDQGEETDNEEDVELHESSTECVNGSAESTNSSQSEWEETLQLVEGLEADQEIRLSSSSSLAQDDEMSNKEGSLEYVEDLLLLSKKMVDDESVYLSSESQQEESQDSDELSNNDEQSAEARDTGRSEIEEEEQLEDHEESARHSSVSSKSTEESARISSSSFEFPALQCQWIGSPDIWPKSETLETISFRKSRSRKVCLRLCRF